jgi:hypothetical protein
MDRLTYVLAAVAIVVGIVIATIGSGIWLGWWRQRHWPHDDL